MKIPDEVKKCVAFVLSKDDELFHPEGTAFFVSAPILGGDGRAVYAVTARHVIEKIEERTTGRKVYLRMNLRNSEAECISTYAEDWHFHPTDDTVDVAVLPMKLDGQDHLACPIEMFVTEDVLWRENIGLGEEIFSVGLFVLHSGTKRNIPIIKGGHISAMPEDRINTEWCPAGIEGYLIEARSVKGLSGSPVFVHLRVSLYQSGEFPEATKQMFYLLGLTHGHWNSRVSTIDMIALDKEYNEVVNAGIAIVVPAKKIEEVINRPELVSVAPPNNRRIRP
jgi:hypothetical protein